MDRVKGYKMFIYLKLLVFIVFFIVNQSVFAFNDIENEVTGEDAIGIVNTGDNNITTIKKITNTGIPLEQFVALSQQLGVTESALKSFFKILEQQQVPSEDLDSTLREIAKRYKDLLVKVGTLNSNDESINLLIKRAEQALENGEFDKTESLFNLAKKQSLESAKKRKALIEEQQVLYEEEMFSAALSAEANGELKMTQLAYKEAGEYYQEAADLLPKAELMLKGENRLSMVGLLYQSTLAEYLNQAGVAFNSAGLYTQAKLLLERALVIREKIFIQPTKLLGIAELLGVEDDVEHFDIIKLFNKAKKILNQEHPDFSEETREMVLEGWRIILIDFAENIDNLAGLHTTLANYAEAKFLHERALTIREEILDQEHPEVAKSLNNLGMLHLEQGNYEQAKSLLERSLAISEKAYGKEDSSVATIVNNLAASHDKLGNKAEAKSLYERSLAIREKISGQAHPDVALALNNLAGSYADSENYERAKVLYENALAIWEKVYGSEHPRVAVALSNLANMHRELHNYEQAKPLHERALAIREKTFGKEHPEVAESIYNLAFLHESQGNYEQAKPLYERAVKIIKKFLGDDHPTVRTLSENYNDLLSKMNEDAPPE